MSHATTAIERFAGFVRALTQAVVTRAQCQVIAQPQANWVVSRLQALRDKFRRLAASIASGTYQPRKTVARPAPPLAKNPVNHVVPRRRGWLADHLPDAAQYRGMLRDLLNDPQTQALIAAAPAEMARLLRPVCWLLKLPPPPFLANPRRPGGSPPPVPYRPPPDRPPSPAERPAANTLGLHPVQLGFAGPQPKSA